MYITVKDCDIKYYDALKEMGFHGLDFSFGSYKERDALLSPEYAQKVLAKKEAMDRAEMVPLEVSMIREILIQKSCLNYLLTQRH